MVAFPEHQAKLVAGTIAEILCWALLRNKHRVYYAPDGMECSRHVLAVTWIARRAAWEGCERNRQLPRGSWLAGI